jgi:hypothetical protein
MPIYSKIWNDDQMIDFYRLVFFKLRTYGKSKKGMEAVWDDEEQAIQRYEEKGMTRSDAQAAVEADNMRRDSLAQRTYGKSKKGMEAVWGA